MKPIPLTRIAYKWAKLSLPMKGTFKMPNQWHKRRPGSRKLAQTSLRGSPKNASLVEIGFGERGNWKLLVSAYNKLTFCWKFSNKLSWEYFWIQRRILFLELFCLLNSWGIFCSTKRTQKWKLYASKTCEMIQQQAISKFWKRTVLETVLHSSNVMMVAMLLW